MDSDTTTPTSRPRHLLPLCALLTLAACEAGTGDTDDATSAGDTTTAPGETGEPTTGAAQTTGAPTTTGDDDTTGEPGETSADDTTTDDTTTDDATTDDATTADATTGEPVEAPEIAGMYTDEYGSMHTIDAAAWTLDTSVFHVLAVDNATDHLVAENDAQNDFNPGLFSRFDWHVDADDVHYCQTVYDAPSQADAEAAEPADADDLVMGCGGFPWTLLTP